MPLNTVFSSFSSFHAQSSTGKSTNAFETLSEEPKPLGSGVQNTVDLKYQRSQLYTYSTSATSTDSALSESNTAATTILNFISLRLRADADDGVSQEDLSKRLGAGLEGFVEGFNDAYQQLDALGFLYRGVEVAINSTFDDVLGGIDALASDLGIESPVTDDIRSVQNERRAAFRETGGAGVSDKASQFFARSELVATRQSVKSESIIAEGTSALENVSQLLEAARLNYERVENKRFSFDIQTRDGDTVRVRAAFASSTLLDGESIRYNHVSGERHSGEFRSTSGFYLDIQGELDDSELRAIDDVLSKVREVSDLFFSGDIVKAFESAKELGFDEQEIAQFSLSLRSVSLERVSQAYQVGEPGVLNQKTESGTFTGAEIMNDLRFLSRFIDSLEKLYASSERSAIKNVVFAEKYSDTAHRLVKTLDAYQNIKNASEAEALQ